MSKVKMPEPVAAMWWEDYSYKQTPQLRFEPWPPFEPLEKYDALITTDQAEAYAEQCVQAALQSSEITTLRKQRDDYFFALQEITHPEAVRADATEIARNAIYKNPLYSNEEIQTWERLRAIARAAQSVLSFTESAHRPPVREAIPTGATAAVRVHELANLHDALHPDNPAKTQELVDGDGKPIEPYKVRIINEKKELDHKRMKLDHFLRTDATIGWENQNLMQAQAIVMTIYSAILGERLK